MAMKREAPVSSRAQLVEFRVGARLSAQATAVTIGGEGIPRLGREASSLEELPETVKIRVFAAYEDAFRRRKEELVRKDREKNV